MDKLIELLKEIYSEDNADNLIKVILGNIRKKSNLCKRVTIRPIMPSMQINVSGRISF
ncbi:hypothetical protein [Aminipila sp.]|uniref:hypothetical protein n=1 Tax=Aminipila sp. TaxID=2060095 RepID=UPI0028A0E38E|nr:hypothetical protein [Aminipila sp.]